MGKFKSPQLAANWGLSSPVPSHAPPPPPVHKACRERTSVVDRPPTLPPVTGQINSKHHWRPLVGLNAEPPWFCLRGLDPQKSSQEAALLCIHVNSRAILNISWTGPGAQRSPSKERGLECAQRT